jgi:hypothetical protein
MRGVASALRYNSISVENIVIAQEKCAPMREVSLKSFCDAITSM